MVEFLAYRILDGKLEFKKVPATLKDGVRTVLKDLGREDLANV